MFHKSTLRKMPPLTRKYARLLNELDSITRRGRNLVDELTRLELDALALKNARERGAIIGDDGTFYFSEERR